jgi:hypothetical protein
VPVEVKVLDGRELGMSVDKNGFTMVPHKCPQLDYYDESQVLKEYYPECCRLVKEITGARKVYAFDHNIRASAETMSGATLPRSITGGNQVQTPVSLVHNDYTITSAPQRIENLSESPKVNDTLRKLLGDTPLISAAEKSEIEKARFVFINVWRNITEEPVQDMPLAMCNSQTCSPEDLVTYEIRYVDRVGENYLVKHNPKHEWVYYPEIKKDEAIILKVWDSNGAINSVGEPNSTWEEKQAVTPASFSFHTAFKHPLAAIDCPKRQSIECRLVAVY